ncbi:hypothetical protein DBR36_03895 [Microbacterium sp. HMWF026]|uniref:hypothetical protein n=1 Tax=Microbacterium sp. HMWF026 TaxID=2056861 RepID=UPI000D3C5365|nr:hypothetical protein [Microbacterium sp. HMWF026]PTT21492.1 hypothetical protein DBR36_03895 [Microbacterium sp. HMWF026]
MSGRGARPLRVATDYRAYWTSTSLRPRTFIVNSGFSRVTTRDEAVTAVDENLADLVAVGRPAIANPDLVIRWQKNADENELDQASPRAATRPDTPTTRSSRTEFRMPEPRATRSREARSRLCDAAANPRKTSARNRSAPFAIIGPGPQKVLSGACAAHLNSRPRAKLGQQPGTL